MADQVLGNNKDQDTCDEIGKAASSWNGYYTYNLANYKFDNNFLFLSQWSYAEEQEFIRLRKPKFSFNKLHDFYKKVVGEQRTNTPDLEVRAEDDNTPQQNVDLIAGLVRQISCDSNSDIVYQTAFENALAGGFGAMFVGTRYKDADSFDQEIYLEPELYPDRCFFDPNAKSPTKDDGNYCGRYIMMSKSEFEKEYPDIPYPQSFPAMWQYPYFNWGNSQQIVIAEYYKKEWKKFTLYKLSDGTTVRKKDYLAKNRSDKTDSDDEDAMSMSFGKPKIIGRRESKECKIIRYKAIANRIISKDTIPGSELPLIFCPGEIKIVNQKEYTFSFIRYAIDAQRALNFFGSEIIQAVKNARREQFMASAINVTGSEEIAQMWRNPSIQQGALIYTPDPQTGTRPEKLAAMEISMSVIQQYQMFEQDMQAILGMYDANRGAPGQEISGVALQERKLSGGASATIFFDNLERAIQQAGKVILSMIPEVYDNERSVFTQAPDGKSKMVKINQKVAGATLNDVTTGKYSISIKPGPNFAVQQQQALDILLKLTSMLPEQMVPLTADLIAENIDIEKSPQLVERLQTLVDPQVLAKEKGEPAPPQQPNPQQQMAQQAVAYKQQELQLKMQQLQVQQENSQREAQMQQLQYQLEFERLQQERQDAHLNAAAEVTKAQLNFKSNLASNTAKIAGAHADIVKTHHQTALAFMKPQMP
jgi:hypothetical protein